MTPHTVENAFIKFTVNSNYTRQGDTITLCADRIDNLHNSGVTSGSLALQLWACQAPFTGGHLSGWKLAELELGTLCANHFFSPVKSAMPCRIPDNGDYAVVLVLAEWDGDGYNAIHDFHNYPSRDVFLNPRLYGLVGYRFMDDGCLMVGVERIHNPRDSGNTSGTLTLEFWALAVPYVGGNFSGYELGGVTLGTLAGSETWQDGSYCLQYSLPPPGTYTLVLMLREWVGSGYVTRDYSNFNEQVTFPLVPETQSTPASTVMDNADVNIVFSAQTSTGLEVPAAPVADSIVQNATGRQHDTTQSRATGFFTSLYTYITNIAQWLIEKVKQRLAI